MYICFEATKRGFIEDWRKVICVDGCHLKSTVGGQLLTAVGIDPNNSLYPVAYAVVDVENKDSLLWFFKLLIDDLFIANTNEWVIVTDKQKGLCPAIYVLLSNVEYRHCVMHLYNNFKKENLRLILK